LRTKADANNRSAFVSEDAAFNPRVLAFNGGSHYR
jgi:hypothetical protein